MCGEVYKGATLKSQNAGDGEKASQRRQVTMLLQWQFFVCFFSLSLSLS